MFECTISQILDIKPKKMLNVLNRIIKKIQFDFEYIDLGGGIGIDYENKNKNLILKNIQITSQNF